MAVIAAIFKTPDLDRLKAAVADVGEREPTATISLHCGDDDCDEVLLLVDLPSVERARELINDADRLRRFLDLTGLDYYPPLFVGDLIGRYGGGAAAS